VPNLSPDRWNEISPLLDKALSLREDQQEDWLRSLSSSQPELAAILEIILQDHRAIIREGFLEFSPSPADNSGFLKGQSVGPYTLLFPIGEGGMGRVWLAERSDGRFERRVAIKFLQFSVATRAGAERFKREGRILGSLAHPHIAELLDAGVLPDGQPYMVLEYIEGNPIDQFCDSRALDVNARIGLFLEVLGALAHAHAGLIVHRDIKPSNVLVSKDGQVKLLDFGIAKLLPQGEQSPNASLPTVEGGAALTPQFAAPEQVTGGAITTGTDVYAAGVLLYLLLTGQHPAGTALRSPAELFKAIVELDPERPSNSIPTDVLTAAAEKRATTPDRLRRQLRGDVDTIALKSLKKLPGERYGSATAFAEDLHRYLNRQPISARPDTLGYRTVKFVSRNRIAVTLTAFAILAVTGGLIGTLIQGRTARRERDAAIRERDRANRIAEFMTGIFKVSDPNETAGQSVTAREVLDKAANDINSNLTSDPQARVQLLDVMGRAYLNLGLFSRAESLFQQGIRASESSGRGQSRVTLSMTHDLGWAVLQQGRIAEAEGIERKLVDTQSRVLGPEDGDTLATMEELAFTLCDEGEGACAEGIELTRKVLDQQKRTVGPDAKYTLVTMNDLAIMLANDHRLDEALELQQDSVNRHLRVFGPANIGTVNAMLNLGEFQRDAGDEDDAAKTFRNLLGIEGRFFGPDQLETAVTKYDLASVLLRKGQRSDAISLLRQSVEHGLAPRILQGLPKDPLFAALHNDPRFAALVGTAHQRFRLQPSPNKN